MYIYMCMHFLQTSDIGRQRHTTARCNGAVFSHASPRTLRMRAAGRNDLAHGKEKESFARGDARAQGATDVLPHDARGVAVPR